jgi:UDP-3-O-[3-hydroxymyristoyl] glucosamine N-acyltransferase
MNINSTQINQIIETDCLDYNFSTLGLVNSTIENTLAFIDSEKFINEAIKNFNIKGLFILDEIKESILIQRPDIKLIICGDPRYYFYSLQNYIAHLNFESSKFESKISRTAQIHKSASISEYNVVIEDNVVIEPNVTILADVYIGKESIVRAGAVLGSEGFEHKRTSMGILSVKHDGKVIIGSNVEIGANCTISKGFAFLHTTIGNDTKLDNLVHVAHGVTIGDRCFLPACCMIAGSCVIGDDVWIGPGASISSQIKIDNQAFITIGSVVTKNVLEGDRVTGNFALSHQKFLRILKNNLTAINND